MCNQFRSELSSEGVRVVTSEPFAIDAAIVADDADHLVHVGAHLHAAGQADEARVALLTSREALLLHDGFRVELIEPGVGDVHRALSTADAGRVEVEGNLMSTHLVLFIAAFAVSPDARRAMTLKNLKQTLTCMGSHTTGNTIRRHAVDPNDLVCHLNSTIRGRRSKGTATTKHTWERTYNS